MNSRILAPVFLLLLTTSPHAGGLLGLEGTDPSPEPPEHVRVDLCGGRTVRRAQLDELSITDQEDALCAELELPSGLRLRVLDRTATLSVEGTLPGRVQGRIDAGATGVGRVRLDIPGLDLLPDGAGVLGVGGSAAGVGLTIDEVDVRAELARSSRGLLLALPVRVLDPRLEGYLGVEYVREHVVLAVQGFRLSAQADGVVEGGTSAVPLGVGRDGGVHHGFDSTVDFEGLPLEFRESWDAVVAVVGFGWRGEHGGFHLLTQLHMSGETPELDGSIDLRDLRMPGLLGDLELSGHGRAGGFSGGGSVRLFTFARHAVGGEVNLFVSQEIGSLDLGLSYQGHLRGPLLDQEGRLEVGFQDRAGRRIALVPGIRVATAFSPDLSGAGSLVDERFAHVLGTEVDAGPLGAELEGVVHGGVRASYEVDRPAGYRNRVSIPVRLELHLSERMRFAAGLIGVPGEGVGGFELGAHVPLPGNLEVGCDVARDRAAGDSILCGLGGSFKPGSGPKLP